jgi:hypothetical protein
MNAQIPTWRALLQEHIRDQRERQRLAQAVGLHPITLVRWANEQSQPREHHLRALVEALPLEPQQQLKVLLAQDYPHLFNSERALETTLPLPIPSAFYAQIINILTTDATRSSEWTAELAILLQLLAQLDPHQQGMFAFVVACVPALPGQPVRSLRRMIGRGSGIWQHTVDDISVENATSFYGFESQAGVAAVMGHPIVFESREEKLVQFPTDTFSREESSLAMPILRTGRVAGSLCLVSVEPLAFSSARLDLVQRATELLAFAFAPDAFYELARLTLGIMPARSVQMPVIAYMHQRVNKRLIQARQQEYPLTRTEVEQQVWHDMEEEMFQLAL